MANFYWNKSPKNLQETVGHSVERIKQEVIGNNYVPMRHKLHGLGWTGNWDNTSMSLTIFIEDKDWPMLEQEIIAAEMRQKRKGKV